MFDAAPALVDLAAFRRSLEGAALVDVHHTAARKGRQIGKEWVWIVDHKKPGEAGHYSDHYRLDAFGRWELCRRTDYIADRWGGKYARLDYTRGELANLRGMKAWADAVAKRVEGWYCYTVGGFDSYKPTPWK